MRVALIVMADLLVLVVALLAVNEYHGLRRYATFTVPYTDRLIAHGVLDPGSRERILREDKISHIVGMALSVAVWLMLTLFFAGVSGAIAFPVGVAVLLVALKPGNGESAENRERYFRVHQKDIDAMKYHEFLKSLEDSGDGDGISAR